MILGWAIAGNLAALAVAVLLLRRGWWPRRAGTAPHCRACGYNLSGAVGEACPECGADLRRRPPRVGERRRRHRLAVIGALLLAVVIIESAGVGFVLLRGADIYASVPAGWLIAALDWPSQATPAWNELQQRAGSLRLTKEEYAAWVQAAVDGLLEPGGPPPGRSLQPLTLVISEVRAGTLPAQSWRELAQRWPPSLPPGSTQEAVLWQEIAQHALARRVLGEEEQEALIARAVEALANGRTTDSAQAFALLRSAVEAEVLRESQQQAFIDAALARGRSGWRPDLIGTLFVDHAERIPRADWDRLLTQSIALTLSVRPDNTAGKTIRWRYAVSNTAPPQLQHTFDITRVLLDGEPIDVLPPERRLGAAGVDTGRLAPLPPGEHRLLMEVRTRARLPAFLRGRGRGAARQGYVGEGRATAEATFRVRRPEEGDEVALVRTPALAPRVEAGMTVRAAEWALGDQYPRSGGQVTRPPGLMVIFDNAALPVAVAFDVFAEADGQLHRMTPVVARPGSLMAYSYGETAPPTPGVTLILRPSADVARDTLDLTGIWGEELRFDHVRVRIPPDNQ